MGTISGEHRYTPSTKATVTRYGTVKVDDVEYTAEQARRLALSLREAADQADLPSSLRRKSIVRGGTSER